MKSALILLLFSCITAFTLSSAVPEQQWEPENEEAAENEDSKITKITVNNGGSFGDWRFLDACPDNSTAVGFQLKVERSSAVDATGVNAIRLYCVDFSSDPPAVVGTITSYEQIWGSWGDRVNCLGTAVLTAFQLKVEAAQGGGSDDSGVNDVHFRCSNGEELSVTNGGAEGEWGEWSEPCPLGICGIEVKTESDQGAFIDDTAVNDARFLCC